MIADIIVLLLLAAATGAGIGGGGLLVVYLTLFRGYEQISAQAINLAFFILSAFSSAALQWKNHSLPSLRLIALCSAAAIPGVFVGTFVRNQLSGNSLRAIFGVLLLITGLSVLWKEYRHSFRRSKKKRLSH